ncbi:uncharacterized protein LAJ45_00978 [Morchella importuna]|uniref:uncharacterized protein n=1 Tax=Morchella importuna TaxID=1174673 RepID=UPI001E8D9103|nr:uncharacterized protein LAJ45_00978 [Morchella importuna]KAH8154451.1 hypothetical protein LAJ45_00978 [Morchella importuna]
MNAITEVTQLGIISRSAPYTHESLSFPPSPHESDFGKMSPDCTHHQPHRDSGYETLGSPQFGGNGSYNESVYSNTTPVKGSNAVTEHAAPAPPEVAVSAGSNDGAKDAEEVGKKPNNLLRRIRGGLWGASSLRAKQSIARAAAQFVNKDGEETSEAAETQKSEKTVVDIKECETELEKNENSEWEEKPTVELPLSNPVDASETTSSIDAVVRATTSMASPLWKNGGPGDHRINTTILLRAKRISSGPRSELSALFHEPLEPLSGVDPGLVHERNDELSTYGYTIGSRNSNNWHPGTFTDSLHSYIGSSDEEDYLSEGESWNGTPRGRLRSNDKGCTASDVHIRSRSRSQSDETVKYKPDPPKTAVPECPVFRFPPPMSQPSKTSISPNGSQDPYEEKDDMTYTLSLPSSMKSSVYSYGPTTPPSTPILRTPPPEGVDYVLVEIEPFLVPNITVHPGESMLDMCMEMNQLAQDAPEIFTTPPRHQAGRGSSDSGRFPFDSKKNLIGKTLGRAFGKLFRRNTVQPTRSAGRLRKRPASLK